MTIEALAAGVVVTIALFWGTQTRVSHLTFFFFLMIAGFWTWAAIFEPLTHEQLIRWAVLSWWIPFAPWAVLRVSWIPVESARLLRDAFLTSRAATAGSIQIRRFLVWWPMVRIDLGALGRGRLVFHEDKYGLFGRFTLWSPSIRRSPWFYAEERPAWPAWMRLMRRHWPPDGRLPWHYHGRVRGLGLLDDPELQRALGGLPTPAILSRPSHLTLAFTWPETTQVRRHRRFRGFVQAGSRARAARSGHEVIRGLSSSAADDILDALERVARRWAELSSGTAVPTA